MGLDVVDVARLDTRVAIGSAQHLGLAVHARCCHEAPAAAVVGGAASPDDRVDPVAVGSSTLQGLQDDDRYAFAADVAVRGRVPEPGAPIARQHSGLGQRDGQVRRQHDVDATGERESALPGAEALTGQVDGEQRRSTGRVQRHARAAQVESVGQAPGRGAAALRTDGAVHVADPGRAQQPGVLGGQVSQEDRGAAASQDPPRLAGVLERLPRRFQQHALLGVQACRLAG